MGLTRGVIERMDSRTEKQGQRLAKGLITWRVGGYAVRFTHCPVRRAKTTSFFHLVYYARLRDKDKQF